MGDYVWNSGVTRTVLTTFDEARDALADLVTGLASLEGDDEPLPALRLPAHPWELGIPVEQAGRAITLVELTRFLYDTDAHDAAAFFDALISHVPADIGLTESEIDALLRVQAAAPHSEFADSFAAAYASGLDGVLCALTHSTLISLTRAPLWDLDQIGFSFDGEDYTFDHIAKAQHASAIRARRVVAIRAEITRRSFWERRGQAFPHLLFGEDVATQLQSFDATLLPLLFRRFAELDALALRWKTENTDRLPADGPEVKPESQATMDNYGNLRRFRGADGAMRTFELHVWVDRGHRIHLYAHREQRQIEIGYVGPHLKTMLH